MLGRILFVLLVVVAISPAMSQGNDHELANMYYTQGEFDKALGYYENLVKRSNNPFYIERYVECLVKTGDINEAEKQLKKIVRREPMNYQMGVLLGSVLEEADRKEEADKVYREMIDNLPSSSSAVIDLSNRFKSRSKFDWSLETLLKGRKLLKDRYPLNIQLAEAYGALGKTEEMINEYIGLIDYSVAYKSSVQNIMARYLSFEEGESEEYEMMRRKLLERIQKSPDEKVYSELLIWLYLHRGNFAGALIQAKALDRRYKEEGRNVLELGVIAKHSGDYKTARKAFQYVKELGEDKVYFYRAEKELLNTSFIEVTQNRSFNKEEISQTVLEYETVLDRVGKSANSFNLILELAEIKAFYAGEPTSARSLLTTGLTIPGVAKMEIARAKLLLGDIEVLLDNIWEASLFYMQVDKDFKYDAIGAEAKLKNARIFYYDGEFVFAQSQLDVLKGSTSKLIANDAMKLSLLITDNLGLDSNYTAMRQFAQADLLLEQHQYERAFAIYDSVLTYYPFHGLADEVLMRKASAMQYQGRWKEAIPYLEKVYNLHGQDILADDAIMQLAVIYDYHVKDKEKAKEWYRKILFDYKGSLHVIEARKRFRELTSESSSVDNTNETP
ncbi:tetratricopeptide repeat protein [Wandonia haliotis]|uniref:Tetratricopeptide repeat protein n=1 Tax=Wandonia haliotis TaxID=574963 RepID=A0ABN1MM47_9FLAO